MEKIKALLASAEIKKFTDFLDLSQKIEQEIESHPLSKHRTIKIALLASFTVKGIKEILLVECCRLGFLPSFYLGGYNQTMQEILNEESGLYQFDPDLIILFIDIQTMLGDLYFLPYGLSDPQRKDWVEEKFGQIVSLIQAAKNHSHARILLHNFEVPLYSPLGILENKQVFGFIESIQSLNDRLREMIKEDTRLFLLDYDAFCSKIGKPNVTDKKMYYLGDMKLSWNYMPQLCHVYLSYIKPLLALTKKCIVLDLDNTLWGGIIGEDGFERIQLGPTPEGRPFLELQQYLLSLYQRGVLLAINSRNNPEEALKVLREHAHMVLKEKHFASIQINWNDKVSNLKAIASEMNIGLESLVFLDDDKANREIVKSALPEVLVVELPEDPSLYVQTVMELDHFNILQLTEEDKKRGESYVDERQRREFKTTTNLEGYLKGLGTVLTAESANPFTLPRISQLTQRTNQFNMTTRRYSEEDIKRFLENGQFLIWSFSVKDKFGDYGIIAVVIVEMESDTWRIDNFLMSCRVIGRKIEEEILAFVLNEAKKHPVKTVSGEFIPSEKNVPAKGFYKNNGFTLTQQNNEQEVWEYELSKEYPFPDCVHLIVKDKT